MAYQGFLAPGGKLSFGAHTQTVHGSINAKNELGIKGRRKLTRDLHSPAYSCFLTRLKTFYGCDVTELTSALLNLEIVKYHRVENLIVSREAIPSKILVTIEHSNCFTTTLQIAVKRSRIVATSEINAKTSQKVL